MMDDILNDSPNTAPVDLGELVNTQPVTTTVPVGAVRNRAATSAILSGNPDQMIEKYRLLMQEGMEGSTVTHDQVMQSLEQQNKTKDMRYVIRILGDRSIPLEQKRSLMSVVQSNGFKEEPAVALQTKVLEAPSQGEDLKGEAARISLADTMSGINKEAQERQRMMNGLMATHPSADASTVADMAAVTVLPFGNNIATAKVAAKVDELEGKTTSLGAWVKNFLLPGSTKADLQQRLMNIPPDRRGPVTQKLLQAIKESAGVFHSDNYYAQYEQATRLLDSPTHSDGEVWAENMSTVLDGFWVASELRNAKKIADTADAGTKAYAGRPKNPGVSDAENVVEHPEWELVRDPHNPFAPQLGPTRPRLEYKRADTQKRLELNSVVRRENPVAPYNVVEQANPASARALFSAIVESPDDEVAQALTGVNREQAIANGVYPQVATESGNVLNKVDQNLKEQVTNTGATRYTPQELESAVNVIKNDFRNASGLQINDAMTTFRVEGDHMLIDGHYSTPGGSFLTPEAAKAQAQYALRGYGIRDDEIVIMKRDGMEYRPVEAGETQPGDYIIKVKTKLPIDDAAVQRWNPLDVKRNWTDMVSQTISEDKGSVSGWLFDPGSMMHPVISGSASIAADQSIVLENMLLRPIREFRSAVDKLPKARRGMIEDYIKEANTNGIPMDHFDLISRGFNQHEIDSLKKWKDIWDNHYYLENFDMVRTLNAQGYHVLDTGGTKLFGRPVAKNQNIGPVLDPQSGAVTHLDKATMDSLYNQGGTYARLRRPINVGGVDVEHIMVRNTPTEYLRKLRDTDQILNYRHGYYTVSYKKGTKFVDELTASGERRTVAVAGNTKDADTFARAQEASTGNKHVVREDSRGFAKDGDGYWDVNNASGRIAQRLRGQPLVSAKGINNLGTGVFVENPMESAARSARSIAGRTVSRPMLETAKRRFMEQYGDLDFLPSDGMGGKRFPNHHSEIVDHRNHTSKAVADARTTYGYIKYLEDGYINSADQLFKGGMNVVANMLDKFPIAENVAQKLSYISPTHALKSTVFNAYIVGSAPIRQWIVQSHQVTRMAAYNPIGMLNGGVEARIASYIGSVANMTPASKNMQSFIKFVEESGMVAGVDRNSLVRGLGLSMADSSSQVKRVVGGVLSVPQTIGFDVGEKMNQLGHLAAVHEKWTRAGKNLADKTVRDLAMTEARALSYDLNRAGELAYTQSTPAMVLQFLQMPHKAMLQLANRKIPTQVALRLAAWDLVMFGVGGGVLGGSVSWLSKMIMGDDNILPDDPDKRDMFLYGMESYSLNKFFSSFDESGDKSRIDFSALAPNDMDGWAKMFHALMNDGAMAALAASPTGQLLAMNGVNGSRRNGRIPQAILTMSRYFNVIEELDPEHPTEFTSVLNDVAKISSLWTARENARMMFETRKKLDAAGSVIDGQVTIPEVWAAYLGFGTLSTKELYQISQHRAEDKKAHEERLMARYHDIMNYYRDELSQPGGDITHIQKVSSMLVRTFDQPGDLDFVYRQATKDLAGKDVGLFKQMMEATGLSDSRRMEDDIKMWPTDQQTKDLMLNRMKDMREVNKRLKEKQ